MYGINSDFQKRNVAIYARVSTEHEAQLSALENQMDWYKPILSARPDWMLTKQYVDEGITGTSAEKRPRFMEMIRDAKAQKFDMIITREVSRFARNTVDTLQYTRLLRDYGVEVFFINDNILDSQLVGIRLGRSRTQRARGRDGRQAHRREQECREDGDDAARPFLMLHIDPLPSSAPPPCNQGALFP